MRFLNQLLGIHRMKTKNTNVISQNAEHAVIVFFNYGLEEMDELYSLEDSLIQRIKEKKVGKYDGHEIAMDNTDGSLYMYGPNAEILFRTVEPILRQCDFMKGAIAYLRFGEISDNVPEIEVEL